MRYYTGNMTRKFNWFGPPKSSYVGLGVVSWQGWVVCAVSFALVLVAMYFIQDELLSIAAALGAFLLFIVVAKLTGGRFTNPDVF